ncbi:response regulator [Paucibacter sp. R3-3]|uniref:Response regulator n=1 Tax=Roseateles agri TaxID=3098619 RepID=A0ABU5DQU8_9BURK|nr:response regulator [Paucibacter sp. R3-3]MDY0747644.1 response regulator [Paucibacter sp. R3-3]
MGKDETRVLVVDDNEDAAEALAAILEFDGYKVRTASNGLAALEAFKSFEPLCVLMDIRMPGLGGHELCSRLREAYGDSAVLIAVTGEGRRDDGIAEAFAQFDHYLRKPIDPGELRKILPPV